MIDCSHGNSQKNHKNQKLVAENISGQLSNPDSKTAFSIFGVMIESHLVEGRQNISDATGPLGKGLVYGKSITDACINWDDSVKVLERLAAAVKKRRSKKSNPKN
jgi:3-deoxy-7-phosphoheptulonate synthase